ncbi:MULTISPECIES: aspartyl-phosphate phosphatase Spo0E family protein [Bacillus]|uniref:aspartyl-phosphate phosphatase Spo0E family protein n=1 Tax=Bacillus TaxID=1386 RepID=UPI001D0D32C8|nr:MULTISPECIES: aspartyl-phosphate phosphatase Spo0E family protein [Bacillus]
MGQFILENEIEKYRKEMVKLAQTHGFTSDKTVKCSQHLDYLLNLLKDTKYLSIKKLQP